MNFRLRPEQKQQLIEQARLRNDGRPESMTQVVERLIIAGSGQPKLFT